MKLQIVILTLERRLLSFLAVFSLIFGFVIGVKGGDELVIDEAFEPLEFRYLKVGFDN